MYFQKVSLLGICLSGIFFMSGCGSSSLATGDQQDLPSLIENADVFQNHFTGFALYDPSTKSNIYSYNSDKYFTPASNTKIFTLYAGLCLMADFIPSFRYIIKDDSLIMKGMGDPTFLHPLWSDHPAVEFLKKSNKKIFLVTDAFQDESLGEGWAWDDYMYDYQAEKSALPLYGNLVQINYDTVLKVHNINPAYFNNTWSYLSNTAGSSSYTRSSDMNDFRIRPDRVRTTFIPFKTDEITIKALLSDTLHTTVKSLWDKQLGGNSAWTIMSGVPADSVYAHMMKVSDNFIAEQLMLGIGALKLDTLNTAKAIAYATRQLYKDAPDTLHWVDGSGLSRYNLFTPRTIVYVLDKLYHRISMDHIKQIFATGGVSGTIQKWYGGTPSYVYAKTGSLSNNHALSGYLITHSGKTLIFSFMHSNYTGSVIPIRQEMQKVLEFIRDHY